MRREIFLLSLGALAGAVVVAYLRPPQAAKTDLLATNDPAATRAMSDVGALLGDTSGFSQASALHALAAYSSARDLLPLLRDVAALPSSRARQLAFEVLLARLAEIDSRGALDVLRTVSDPDDAHAAAMAILGVIGDDVSDVEAILAALPRNADARRFQIDVIGDVARRSPSTALQRAVLIDDPSIQAGALQRIAEAWTVQNPRAAMDELEVIQDRGLRNTFQSAVLREWARVQPLDMIAYFGERDDPSVEDIRIARSAIEDILSVDPLRMLSLADGLPLGLNEFTRRTALGRLAEQDPTAALEYLEEVPSGAYRDLALANVAGGYARNDPDAALAWARNYADKSTAPYSRPRLPMPVLAMVIGEVSEFDADRALQMTLGLESATEQVEAFEVIGMNGATAGDTETLANKILALPDSTVRDRALQTFAASWMTRDTVAALEWLTANGAQVGPGAFRQLAQQLSARDPATAARFTSSVPIEARAFWLESTARDYARFDPAGALKWIGEYQGQNGYDLAASALVQGAAEHDPQGAARLLASVRDTTLRSYEGAVANVGYHWAQQDPMAAAQWALGLDSVAARTAAVGAVAGRWAERDVPAARSWAMGLPEGGIRDRALVAMVAQVARTTTPDASFLNAVSTDEARRDAVTMIVSRLAQDDRSNARAWIDTYLRDPALRAHAEQTLEGGVLKPRVR